MFFYSLEKNNGLSPFEILYMVSIISAMVGQCAFFTQNHDKSP